MIDIPSSWTAEDVRQWLLKLFTTGVSELIGTPRDVAMPVAIQAAHDRAQPDTREALKAGTVLALLEWRLAAHGYPALEELSQTAALLRATGAIPVLESIARRLLQRRADTARSGALSAVIACLAGFPGSAHAERALQTLFYAESIDPSVAGQLFVGLCACNPDIYPKYVPRFLELRRAVPGSLMDIGDAFLDAVPTVMLMQHLDELDHESQNELAAILQRAEDPELAFPLAADGTISVIWLNGPVDAVPIKQVRNPKIKRGVPPDLLVDEIRRVQEITNINVELERFARMAPRVQH